MEPSEIYPIIAHESWFMINIKNLHSAAAGVGQVMPGSVLIPELDRDYDEAGVLQKTAVLERYLNRPECAFLKPTIEQGLARNNLSTLTDKRSYPSIGEMACVSSDPRFLNPAKSIFYVGALYAYGKRKVFNLLNQHGFTFRGLKTPGEVEKAKRALALTFYAMGEPDFVSELRSCKEFKRNKWFGSGQEVAARMQRCFGSSEKQYIRDVADMVGEAHRATQKTCSSVYGEP
jgi:hypothetical protein